LLDQYGQDLDAVYGFDGGKKVKGRKRHVLVDSLGLLLKGVVTAANTSER
jgi:putative transposase